MSDFIQEFLVAERDRHRATLRQLVVELKERPLTPAPVGEEPKKVIGRRSVRRKDWATEITAP